ADGGGADAGLLDDLLNLLGNLRRAHWDVLRVKFCEVGAGLGRIAVFPLLHLSLKEVETLLQVSLLRFLRGYAGTRPEQIGQQRHVHHGQCHGGDPKSFSRGLQIAHQMPSLFRPWAGRVTGAAAGMYSLSISNVTRGVPVFASLGASFWSLINVL